VRYVFDISKNPNEQGHWQMSSIQSSEVESIARGAERGRVALAALRPHVSSRLDLARARGGIASTCDEPSRFPCQHGVIFVGRGGHALDIPALQRLRIGAVLNCAPNVCADPVKQYEKVPARTMPASANR